MARKVLVQDDGASPVQSYETGVVVISEADPGAIGAGNFWLRFHVGQEQVLGLFVRNVTDDDWYRAAFGTAAMDAPADAAPIETTLYDEDASVVASQIYLGSNGPGISGLVGISAFKQDNDNYEGSMIRLGNGVTDARKLELIIKDVTTGSVTAGLTLDANGLSLPGLPTSNPGAGLVWADAGVLKVGT